MNFFQLIDKNQNSSKSLYSLSKSDLITFDDDLLKTLKCALVYFKTHLFKTTCLCDRVPTKRKLTPNKRHQQQQQVEANLFARTAKTCIFCHLFKTYEKNRRTTPSASPTPAPTLLPPNTATAVNENECISASSLPTPVEQTACVLVKANLDAILVEHSYCKQPATKAFKKHESPPRKQLKKLEVDFDDGLLLEKVVNERLNRLFDGKKTPYKTLFDEDFELDLKQDVIVEAGFDLSSSDIKKLPNLSYEE